MSKTCAACKTNPAILMVSALDKETGAYSTPFPLCENCYLKISKTRTIKITDSDSPAYLKNTVLVANNTNVTSIASATDPSDTVAYRNFRKLGHICDVMSQIFICIAIICGIATLILALALQGNLIWIIGVAAVILSVFNIVLFDMLTLYFDGIADYMKRK